MRQRDLSMWGQEIFSTLFVAFTWPCPTEVHATRVFLHFCRWGSGGWELSWGGGHMMGRGAIAGTEGGPTELGQEGRRALPLLTSPPLYDLTAVRSLHPPPTLKRPVLSPTDSWCNPSLRALSPFAWKRFPFLFVIYRYHLYFIFII